MGPLGQVFLAVSWIILAICVVINTLMVIFR
jgi:hypothetical protein